MNGAEDLLAAIMSTHLRPAIGRQPWFKKEDRNSLLNLSSNEMQHPELAELFKLFARDIPVLVDPAKYPVFEKATIKLCQSADLPSGSCALTPGSDAAIRAMLETFGAREKVISFVPCYRAYADYPTAFGATLFGVDLNPQSCAIARLITAIRNLSPALVVLTNPDGITGAFWPLTTVDELASEAGRHGSLLLVDEAYAAFAPIDHTSLILKHANMLVVRSYSKSHGAAGIRLAAVFARKTLIDYFLKTRVSNGVSAIALAYLQFVQQHHLMFQKIISDVIDWRSSYETYLRGARADWSIARSRANFIFLTLPSAHETADILQALENRSIVARPVSFGETPPSSLRLTIVEPNSMEPVLGILSGGIL